jgi:hypothetical protein
MSTFISLPFADVVNIFNSIVSGLFGSGAV